MSGLLHAPGHVGFWVNIPAAGSHNYSYRAQSSAGALGNVVKWILMEVSYNQKFRTCVILESGR